jgi:hypothetical protein
MDITVNYSSSWNQFECSIKEASPYLIQQLIRTTSRGLSEIEKTLEDSYSDDKFFQQIINLIFGEDYKKKIIPRNKKIAKSVLDLDLWFLIFYQLRRKKWKITIPRKFTGRLFELLFESILKTGLSRTELDYWFVDYDPVDYMILEDNKIICNISCKTVLSENKLYHYDKHANVVEEYLNGKREKFIVFCGVAKLKEKEIIRERFEKIQNCRLFYLWERPGKRYGYTLDSTFYDLIDFMKNL